MRFNRFLLAVVFVATQFVIPRIANASSEEITVQIKFGTLCLTTQQTLNSKVSLANCSVNDSGQLFQIKQFPSLTKVQNGNFCLWAPNYGNGIDLQNTSCKDSYLWNVDSSTLKMTGVSREYCLDIENGSASTGAIAQIWTCLYPAIAAQTFSLVDIKLPSPKNPNRVIIELPSTPSPGSTVPPGSTPSPIDIALTNPWIPAPHRQSARCVNYLFVGFRGSGQQPTGFDENYVLKTKPLNWSENDFLKNQPYGTLMTTPAVDHLGYTLGGLYEAVRIRYKKLGKTVGFYSVGVSDAAALGPGSLYAATPAPTVTKVATYIRTIALETQIASNATSVVLTNYLQRCSLAKILIAGYSQGALMAKALAFNFNKTKLEGVMLIADPLFNRFTDKDYLVAFNDDHQTSGILRNDISLICDRNPLTRSLCAIFGRQFPGFFALWAELRNWRESSPSNNYISTKTAKDLESVSKRVGVICDSGDLVCSPIRFVYGIPGLTNMIDSDLENRIKGSKLIHERYGKVDKPGEWWKQAVVRWLD